MIDENAQEGRIRREQALFAGALIMVVRDYVRPLPPPPSEDGADHYGDDLRTMVDALRTAHGS